MLFVGGAVSVDRYQRTLGKTWWEGETSTFQRPPIVDVVFSHDAPYCSPIVTMFRERDEQDQKAGLAPVWPLELLNESLDNTMIMQSVFELANPKYWFHGHYHIFDDSIVDGCRFVGLRNSDANHGFRSIKGHGSVVLFDKDSGEVKVV
jgi:hypothetical protein